MRPCACCGKRTRSHNIAIDVSEHDSVGLPTLAMSVCHTCWAGNTKDTPSIRDVYTDAANYGGEHREKLLSLVDLDRATASPVPVEELR